MFRAKGSSDELQRLFQAARRDVPSATTQQKFHATVMSEVRLGALGPAELPLMNQPKPALLHRTLTKVSLIGGVVVLSALGISQFQMQPSLGQKPAITASNALSVPSVIPPVTFAHPSAIPPSQGTPELTLINPATEPVKPIAHQQGTKDSTVPSEASLIDQAHRFLPQAPKRALAMTEKHRKLYPTGILSQEREVIAIEALKRIGESQAAEQRAKSFREEQPHSIHESRLRSVLGEKGEPPTP
jgi:hypothetical protein